MRSAQQPTSIFIEVLLNFLKFKLNCTTNSRGSFDTGLDPVDASCCTMANWLTAFEVALLHHPSHTLEYRLAYNFPLSRKMEAHVAPKDAPLATLPIIFPAVLKPLGSRVLKHYPLAINYSTRSSKLTQESWSPFPWVQKVQEQRRRLQ